MNRGCCVVASGVEGGMTSDCDLLCELEAGGWGEEEVGGALPRRAEGGGGGARFLGRKPSWPGFHGGSWEYRGLGSGRERDTLTSQLHGLILS